MYLSKGNLKHGPLITINGHLFGNIKQILFKCCVFGYQSCVSCGKFYLYSYTKEDTV